ncbi:MAG: PilW family protein, partial [Gemmatimonadota bacterium]
MKNSHRGGFTLVELLIVTVLGALTLGVVYETLIVQEKSFAAARGVMDDQETLRTGLGILESELREVGSIGGDAIGGTDFATIDSDELRFRAQRKLGFICTLHRNDKWALVHSFGDPFVQGDGLLLFVEGNPDTGADDEWDDTVVTSAQEDDDATCLDRWPGVPLQLLKLENQDLTGVTAGSPVRGYEWVTYGLYDFGDLGW